MKRFFAILALVAILVPTSLVLAGGVNRSPDLTLAHGPALNIPAYWEEAYQLENCVKTEGDDGGSPDTHFLAQEADLLVLKAGLKNFVWFSPGVGEYGTVGYWECKFEILGVCLFWKWHEPQDISHSIVCRVPEYEPCSETVPGEKVFGDWYPIGDENWNDWVEDGDIRFRTGSQLWGRDWYQNIYDAEDLELICDVNEGTQKQGQLMKEEEEAPCIGMYYLPGDLYYDYPCYLNRNPLTDSIWHLPERFDGTEYMQDLCNQLWTCEGWTTGEFHWDGTWSFVCDYEPCLDCE